MTSNSKWSVPFRRVKNVNDPLTLDQLNAVVLWVSRGYEQTNYPVFPEIEGSPMKSYISKWQHNLMVDLWFFKFSLRWVGRHKAPPNAAS